MLATSRGLDFHTLFGAITDPRRAHKRLHGLLDILFLCVMGTLAGCEGPSEIALFGRLKLAWVRRFVPLKNGVPSHDTLGRMLALVKPDEVQKAFLQWSAALTAPDADTAAAVADGQPRFVPIDGKTLRGSHGAKDRANPLHMVSAWSSQQGLTLGQVAVDDKSNEITAIPRLLQMLDLKGAIVTIDAMGCQKEIAAKVIEAKADYLLAVKDNQPTLAAAVTEFFVERQDQGDFVEHACRRHKTVERSRGRTEERYYTVAPLPKSMKGFQKEWKGLKSIGQVINITTVGDQQTSDVRYYIGSREPRVKEFATGTRSHWGIESMHWVLDVVFGEDDSRLRNGHIAENFSMLRKFALGILMQDTSEGSLKGKRKSAGWSNEFLEKLLFLRWF